MTSVRWKQPLDCVSIPDGIAADLSNVITSAWISRMAHKPEASSGEEEGDFGYESHYWYMVCLDFRGERRCGFCTENSYGVKDFGRQFMRVRSKTVQYIHK